MNDIIDPFFTSEELNQLAIDSNFVQRKGKIDGHLFFDLIIFHSEDLKSQSLNDLSAALNDRHGIEIQKQSLHERFNNNALSFLKMSLEKILQSQIDYKSVLPYGSCGFNRILIKDSTCFQIDESLREYYPGSGGSGSKASVRIQFEYDLLSGSINDLSVNAFNEQDAKNSLATIELTREGDLIIRDLAYMGINVLKAAELLKVIYLCRVNPSTIILEKNDDQFQRIDFIELTKFMRSHEISSIEKEVYLGAEEKLKTRMIIFLMPEEEYAKRIRKAEQNNKKKGRGQVGKEFKARAALNLFITNTSAELIPASNVWKFYRLRWQIELIFKVWKSICDISKVKKVKKHRLECYIYSKLILIVFGWKILWHTARRLFCHERKALSFFKASKTLLKRKIGELREIVLLGKGNFDKFLENFYELSKTNHILEKRKQEPSSLELLLQCINF
ncbi:MAG: IS4 family transposase [Desulfosalsimonadaceae bacterium]